MKLLAVPLLITWLIHIGYHAIVRHDTFDFLWTCNMACALLGAGCLLLWRRGVAIGTSWLTYGLPVWIIGVLSGNELMPTAVIIHVGGVIAGFLAFKKLGFPRGTWWRASAALLILMAFSRLLTPPAENVNLVFSVFPGWESLFPTWRPYFLFLFATAMLTFVLVEMLAIKLGLAVSKASEAAERAHRRAKRLREPALPAAASDRNPA